MVSPTPLDRFRVSSSRFDMGRVTDREAWEAVRQLRARALHARHDVAENVELADDGYDNALNTVTFLLKRNGRPVGSTRASVSAGDRRSLLPSIGIFGREIEGCIGWDATLVEASLTVVAPDVSGDPRESLFHLYKAHLRVCALERADWLVTAVPESQIGFHRRMFNMEILSGSERYPPLAFPRVLMGLDYREQADVLFKRIPLVEVREDDPGEFMESGTVRFHSAAEPSARIPA